MPKKKRKKKALPPRRLRMNRSGRLASAHHWLQAQQGRSPVQTAKAYRKHYGVDWECALVELGSLGVRLDPEWVAQLQQSLAGQHRARAQRDAERARLAQLPLGDDCDEYFAYIAGYTSNGVPYGITWEEWREIEAREKAQAGESNVLDETLPQSASPIWPKDKSDEAQAGEDGLEIPF